VRCELLHDRSNVWVTMLHLPATNTPQFSWVKSRLPRKTQPYPPVFQPEVPAEAIFHAAHYRRREMFVGWPTIKTVMGRTTFGNRSLVISVPMMILTSKQDLPLGCSGQICTKRRLPQVFRQWQL